MLDFEQRREALEAAKMRLDNLRDSEQYKFYSQMLQEQLLTHRAVRLHSQISSLDDAFKAARQEGFTAGLSQALAILEQHLQAVQGDLDSLLMEMEDAARND